jgi:predicted ATPase/class 3 adenylate cyclase
MDAGKDLPEGTVTFLFTDIEGSTRLWESFPEAMGTALARHDELLTTAVARHGGVVVKSTGDGFHCVFSSATDAVAAVLAGQRDLMAESWNRDTGRLKVRMALHTGMAEFRDGDYYGSVVNRAARLLAAGHGDQILLSLSTHELVCDDLSQGASLTELGKYQLKDLLRPEHIYQLNMSPLTGDGADDGPDDGLREFPPLRVLSIRHTNLPSQPTPFIGRQQEIRDVSELLLKNDVQLVTLVGSGGTGKSRLALQVAAGLASDFPDGVFFVDLAPIDDTELILSSIAHICGVREVAGQSLANTLHRYFSSRSILLIMDNFEQIIDGAQLLGPLIEAAPGLKLIVTSREALNLREEWLYPLSGMPYPSLMDEDHFSDYGAVQLFESIAQRVRPDFSLSAEREGVIQICQLVEGTPLALELAASWVKSMQTDAIAREIRRNINILSTRLRNIPQRHRSMQAIFRQSWEYLTDNQKEVFARLSVFRGGFQSEAAEEVAGSTVPLLTELVDKSLLRWGSDGRYSIHELLRLFAETQLSESPNEYLTAHNKHCAYFADFLRGLRNDMFRKRHLEAVAEIETELENVKVALSWAIENKIDRQIPVMVQLLYEFGDTRGRYRETNRILSQAEVPLESEPRSRQQQLLAAQLLLIEAWRAIRIGELKRGWELAGQSETILEENGLEPLTGFGADPYGCLGVAANALGDYEEAVRYGELTRKRAESKGDGMNLQLAWYILSNAAFNQGHYPEAHDYARRAQLVAEEQGSYWFLAYILSDMGRIDQVLGHLDRAKANFQRSFRIREEFKDPEGMALALTQLGQIALTENEYTEAAQRFSESHDLYHEIGDRGGLARALSGLAKTAQKTGRSKDASQSFVEALRITNEMGYTPLSLSLLEEIGELLLEIGQTGEGIILLSAVASNPRSSHEARENSRESLTEIEKNYPPDRFTAATSQGREVELEEVINDTLDTLTLLTR